MSLLAVGDKDRRGKQLRDKKMNTRQTLCILIATILAGCALSPPQEVARVEVDRPMLEVAQLVEEMAKKCWERSATVMKDGITIDARMSLYDSGLISAARWASDIGIQDDFIIIEVIKDSEETSTVVISEGDYGCSLDGSCSSLGLNADGLRWLEGDVTCASK